MNEKEYPMSDEYKQQSAQLLELFDFKESIIAKIQMLTPEQQIASRESLQKIDKTIEIVEASLAEQYELHQQMCRNEESINKIGEEIFYDAQIMYVFLKQRAPELLDKFEKVLDVLSPENREEFLDGAAILETRNLDELIAGKIIDNRKVSE